MSAVFVTGATGTVGSALVARLLELDQQVVAGVREPESASLPAAAQLRRFDFGASSGDLTAALAGCDRLFLMRPPPIADVRRFLFPVINAALENNVRQIAFLSLQGVQANRRTPHHAVERYLRTVGAPYTLLRPNFFMQNLSSTYAEQIRDTGRIEVPAGRSRTAFIDARDVGRAAAAVLTSQGHIGKAYTLSGEQSLSYKSVARIMSEVLGRPISYAQPREADYLAQLRQAGAPEDYIAVQKMIYRVVRLNVSAMPNQMVRRLTGAAATTFARFVEDYRDTWTT